MRIDLYNCFIASPYDTEKERQACDEVFEEINSILGRKLNFRIESKKWEKDSRPSFGEDGQDVINNQLLKDFQVFIGIMWSRFGTETKRAGSGTEEEFDQAYNKFINQEDIEIMMYFNEQSIPPKMIDPEQFLKVKEFKEKVSDLGGLYWSYNGVEEFKNALKKHVSEYFIQKLSDKSSDPELKIESEELKKRAIHESVKLVLNQRLVNSLTSFTNQPVFWIDPIICNANEISQNPDENYNSKVDISKIIEEPKNLIIQSPPQFGLTCLSHFLIKEAWNKNNLWIYIDARKAKKNSLDRYVLNSKKELNIEDQKVECIVLDSWDRNEPGAIKLLKNLSSTYKNIPIIVMQTIESGQFKKGDSEENIGRDFDVLQLLALPRNQVRKVIAEYNKETPIADENVVLNKVVSDLKALNIHRTPYNCLTLLKVSEKHFDESPVNRTKMLEMVLFVLFDLGELPTYKIKPDVKDCEYILGIFCEKLIKRSFYIFTRDEFMEVLNTACREKLIELEVNIVFDVLYANRIIVKRDGSFAFKANYWIYYFGAKRMHVDEEFKNYILLEKRYVSFPEIIEFYTGIDRNRSDALNYLKQDISETINSVQEKVGLPQELNPLKLAEWKPSQESIQKLQEEVGEDVKRSNLPDSVKDKYEDRTYNQMKPYDQTIYTVFEEYSVANLMQKIRACSRALRNSDYADPQIKKELLDNILEGWEQISKVLFAMAPILAERGQASIEGQRFVLAGNFGETFEQRMNNVVQTNPTNVVGFFREDIMSEKIGPLLYNRFESESSDLKKHHLVLLLIFSRPKDWHEKVEQYISSLPQNSFYLYDTMNALQAKYRFAFAEENDLAKMRYLLKMIGAKHLYGENKPSVKVLNKVSNNIIPKREVDEEESL